MNIGTTLSSWFYLEGGEYLNKRSWEYKGIPKIMLGKPLDFLGSLSFFEWVVWEKFVTKYPFPNVVETDPTESWHFPSIILGTLGFPSSIVNDPKV